MHGEKIKKFTVFEPLEVGLVKSAIKIKRLDREVKPVCSFVYPIFLQPITSEQVVQYTIKADNYGDNKHPKEHSQKNPQMFVLYPSDLLLQLVVCRFEGDSQKLNNELHKEIEHL